MAFIFNQKVRFKHCDPAGIVFYPRYFEMINDCVEVFFDTELGLPFEEMHKHSGVPTVAISTRFLSPSFHGDPLKICLTCIKIRKSSLALEIAASCNGNLRFTAQPTLVHVGTNRRPKPWPDGLRKALEEFKKEDE